MINPSEVSQLTFLGDAVIKSFLLMAIALTLLLVLRRGSAAVRHHIGLLSLVCLLIAPLLGVILPEFNDPMLSTQVAVSPVLSPVSPFEIAGAPPELLDGLEHQGSSPPAESLSLPSTGSSRGLSWMETLLIIWLTGAVLMFFPI